MAPSCIVFLEISSLKFIRLRYVLFFVDDFKDNSYTQYQFCQHNNVGHSLRTLANVT
jgi:hypothetical protein